LVFIVWRTAQSPARQVTFFECDILASPDRQIIILPERDRSENKNKDKKYQDAAV
jgi:hypothetical protein